MYTLNVYQQYYIFIHQLLLTLMALILWLHYIYILSRLNFCVRYLLNILCPYYKFIKFILLINI
jgi:hypothetical protein